MDRATACRWHGVVLWGALMAQNAAAEEAWPLDALLDVATIPYAAPSPDGERVAYVVADVTATTREARARLWVGSADATAPTLLDTGSHPVAAPAWSPDGQWIAYLRGSATHRQLALLPATGGESRVLSLPDATVHGFRWSPTGSAIAYVREVREPRPQAADDAPAIVVGNAPSRRMLWLLELDSQGNPHGHRALSETDHHLQASAFAFDFAPNGRELAFSHTSGPAVDDWKSANISIVDLRDGHVRPFQQSNAAELAPRYAPNGRQLAFTISTYPPSAVGQWRVGLANRDGSRLRLLAATADQQPEIVGWLGNRALLLREPNRLATALWRLPTDGREPERFDNGEQVLTVATLNRAASRLALVAMDAGAPQEVAVTGLKRFEPRRVSAVNARFAGRVPAQTRTTTWQSDDGQQIEGLLTLPPDHREGSRYPLLLLVHQRPNGTFSRSYPGYPSGPFPLATLAGRGYAVLRANPRGAGGYGHRFRDAGRAWGEADLADLMAGVDHLIDAGIADPDRLMVAGWGHGGFLAAHLIIRSHRFDAAILGAPMTDLVHLRASSRRSGFLVDYLGAEFWEQPALYQTLSPLFGAEQITTPVLILHGQADRQIPPEQGLALHGALDARGLDTRMVLYPEAGHRLDNPAQRLHAAGEILTWLDRHLPQL